MAPPLRPVVLAILLLMGVMIPLVLLWFGVIDHAWASTPIAPTRATLLSNPTIREWMHALSEEEREVGSLKRQSLREPGVPLPAGEALVDEEAQLQRTWRSLLAEWQADGGRSDECPGYAQYHALLSSTGPGPGP